VPEVRHLGTGQELGLSLGAGHEIYCASGRLHLLAVHPWLGAALPARVLLAGQGWRSHDASRVTVRAQQPSRVRVLTGAE
jgi:hypothetical protein